MQDHSGYREGDIMSKYIKRQHPNKVLSFYGDLMAMIGDWFLSRANNYMTWYELVPPKKKAVTRKK